MITTNLHQAFQHLPDPRMSRNRKHNLLDILILSILSVLCGAESWDAIKFFGTTNQVFLNNFCNYLMVFLHMTQSTVFFSCLILYNLEISLPHGRRDLKDKDIFGTVIAIEGKTVRGSKETYRHQSPLHVVSAWSVNTLICLGQCKSEEESNEVTAIPKLFRATALK
ncbi:hypothetical protein EZS27_033822 [termite gut metagenome]|uniref:H repeat-associated protein N-terminal domain-containing protein n=1 Tax=termite gut metagenome TaxID=433724 RepID=A0A5J4Q412_9ZZZZ